MATPRPIIPIFSDKASRVRLSFDSWVWPIVNNKVAELSLWSGR
ncbi:hypothetical protein [Zooshikella harenae]|nr:hypothetical protein [Zooshikella harenae]